MTNSEIRFFVLLLLNNVNREVNSSYILFIEIPLHVFVLFVFNFTEFFHRTFHILLRGGEEKF